MLARQRERWTWDPQFGDHLHSMWRVRWLVLTGALVIGAVVLAWRLSEPTRYEAESQLRLLVFSDGHLVLDEDRLEVAARIYAELAETRPLLQEALVRSGTDYSPDSSTWTITVERDSSPGFLEVTGTARSGANAVALTNAMVDVLIDTVAASPLSAQPDQSNTTLVLETVEEPRRPDKPVAPRPFREAGLATIGAAIVLAEVGALLRLASGKLPSVRTAEKVEEITGVRTVELTGAVEDRTKLALFAGRQLSDGNLVTVVQTGGWPNPAVALLLAEAIGRQGRRVLIVDADPRRPTLDTHLGLPREPGLADVLAGRTPLMEAVHELEGQEGVSVLSVGKYNVGGRWTTTELTRFLASTRAALRFDLILLSLGAASMPTGVAAIMEVALDTALVLTFDPEPVSRRQLNELLHAFGGSGEITGLILLSGEQADSEIGWLNRRWASTPELHIPELGMGAP